MESKHSEALWVESRLTESAAELNWEVELSLRVCVCKTNLEALPTTLCKPVGHLQSASSILNKASRFREVSAMQVQITLEKNVLSSFDSAFHFIINIFHCNWNIDLICQVCLHNLCFCQLDLQVL